MTDFLWAVYLNMRQLTRAWGEWGCGGWSRCSRWWECEIRSVVARHCWRSAQHPSSPAITTIHDDELTTNGNCLALSWICNAAKPRNRCGEGFEWSTWACCCCTFPVRAAQSTLNEARCPPFHTTWSSSEIRSSKHRLESKRQTKTRLHWNTWMDESIVTQKVP